MECSTADHALTDIQDLNIQHNEAAKITLVYINCERFRDKLSYKKLCSVWHVVYLGQYQIGIKLKIKKDH